MTEEFRLQDTVYLMPIINCTYKDKSKLSKVLLPPNNDKTFSYYSPVNLVQTINATDLQTDMVYDLLNRLESIAEDGDTTEYQYDANDNIIAVTDARGKTTSFVYDDFGRRISRTAPDTGTTIYSYDEAGNLETIIDELYRTVGFYYDELNRPISQEYGTTTISFTYDENAHGIGRLSSISDEHGSRSFLYNSLGQLTSETRVIDGISYTTGYGYLSSTGELDSITYPSGMLVRYNRDSNGQVSSVEIDDTTIISAVTHLPFGPLQSATLGSTTLNRTYDQRYNLSSITAGSWHTVYTRDAEGHVTVIEDSPAPAAGDATEDYTYDPLNNQLTAKESTSYTYDAVGNMTSDGSFTFTYDELNRITQVEDNSTTVATYGYDSSNRRIVKTVGVETTHYLYDVNSNLIAEAQADGTINREYIYLDGELIAINDYQDTPGLYYVINDHLGTPQQLIEADGTVVWQAAYLPFGQAQVTINQVENNIRFPGQYFDAETGLHYNWNRYYDPETGRYITADPIGLDGGMNLYAYVGGNPVNAIDPYGLFEFENPISFWQDYFSSFPTLPTDQAKKECVLTCLADKGLNVLPVYGDFPWDWTPISYFSGNSDSLIDGGVPDTLSSFATMKQNLFGRIAKESGMKFMKKLAFSATGIKYAVFLWDLRDDYINCFKDCCAYE